MSGHTPPQGVQKAAQRALRWIEEGEAGRNFSDASRTRARQLAKGESLSDEVVHRMHRYFRRHAVDKDAEGFTRGTDGVPSPGGGDPGKRWARREAGKAS